ncbi:Emopamil-binding protein, partial [Rhizodiscina lignyota]
SPSTGPVIDQTTVLSLLSTLAILLVASLASVRFLPATSSARTRVLFTWHAFDALVHFLLEGSFLYNCFAVSVPISRADRLSATLDAASGANGAAGYWIVSPPGVSFLGRDDRLYGPAYGANPMARLWQEYAKADHRWGGADLTVVSLELLTVFIGGPLAVWVCCLLAREGDVATKGGRKRLGGRASFWISLLATGELYGGFMTFAPEWLSGNSMLDGSNWMYLWLYLVFFNMLWVVFPFWGLVEAYGSIAAA